MLMSGPDSSLVERKERKKREIRGENPVSFSILCCARREAFGVFAAEKRRWLPMPKAKMCFQRYIALEKQLVHSPNNIIPPYHVEPARQETKKWVHRSSHKND